MRGWILFDERSAEVKSEAWEQGRIVEAGAVRSLDIEIVSPDRFDMVIDHEGGQQVVLDGREQDVPGFLIPRLGAGTDYWSLAIVRQLEELGVRVFNGSRCIEASKDKLYTHQLLAASQLPTPKTLLVKDLADVALVDQYLEFPVIVKTLSGTQGAGVCLIRDRASFEDLLNFTRASGGHDPMILQEFIAGSTGRDLRVIVVGGEVVGAMLRSGGDDYKANISQGGTGSSFEVSTAIEELALKTAELLQLEIAGIDLLFMDDGFLVCEANSSPGFSGFEEFTGTDIAARIVNYVAEQLSLEPTSKTKL